jgi:5-methylcytosine-specific restriction endonuclease McrA
LHTREFNHSAVKMGNGAKAQQKRERNQKDSKAAKSQLKVNQQAMDIQCQVCRSTFLKTTKAPALTEHAENKHGKNLADCFPTFQTQ